MHVLDRLPIKVKVGYQPAKARDTDKDTVDILLIWAMVCMVNKVHSTEEDQELGDTSLETRVSKQAAMDSMVLATTEATIMVTAIAVAGLPIMAIDGSGLQLRYSFANHPLFSRL